MRYTPILVLGGLLISCDSMLAGGNAKDQKALQGTWIPKSVIANGKESKKAGINMVIESNSFSIQKGDQVIVAGTFTLDSTKTPAHINMKIDKDQDAKNIGKTAQGIYEVNGNTFKWCSREPGGGNRPDSFTSEQGSRRLLVTFEKAK